jgi:hypothetical protein
MSDPDDGDEDHVIPDHADHAVVSDWIPHKIMGNVSQRSEPLLCAIGVNPHQYGGWNLCSPDYLAG